RLRRLEGVYANVPFPERAHFVPTVFDPEHYKKLNTPKEFDIAIFGSAEGLREGYILALQNRYGPRFHHFGGFHAADKSYIGIDDYVSKLNATKIFVNTQTYPENRVQLKGKVREALSCGTFLLENENPESRHYLRDTPTIFFSAIQDLYEKIDYYLAHEDEREAIAQTGHDWYLENHSPQKWAAYLLEHLSLR
ncbi:MAG: glycosyltransferase, partial [Burkholderiales bacterium]|nr:glycosyltransferase [Burkholderiales bacterium]